jgi:polysaccharide biosynthesis protein PslG
MLASVRSTALCFLLVLSCWPAQPHHQPQEPSRALPLNRFAASRQGNPDPAGFYRMPTAIGDDYFDGTSSMARLRRHFAVARRAGVKYLRCAFSWNGIEKEPGKYDWQFWDNLVALAEGNKIQLIPYVAYTPEWAARDAKDFWKQPPRDPKLYADLMFTLAARYRGRVRSWEIWNEPDNKDYWLGTAAEFADLVMQAATRIRQADPSAVLVLGGMANGPGDFFRTLIAEHHLDRYVDVVAMHAYPESWLNGPAELIFQQWVPQMQQLIAADGSGDDLWLNEMGYPDYRFHAAQASIYGTRVFYRYEHTRQYQAAMLFKMEVMALASQQISLTGWYRIDDFPLSEKRLGPDLVNYHLGVVDARGRAKPALLALRFFNRLFAQPSRLLKVAITRRESSQSIVNVFQTKDGRVIVVGWLRSSVIQEVPQKTGMLLDHRAETVSLQLPCSGARLARAYDAEGAIVATSAQVRYGMLRNMRLSGSRVFIAELRCQPRSPTPAPR